MSVAVYQYWRERLEQVCPFFDRSLLNDPSVTYYRTLQRPTWPDGINTTAFYRDFVGWYGSRYVEPLSKAPEYANATFLPRQPFSRTFFIQLQDFIYIYPYDKPKVRRVRKVRQYEGSLFYESRMQRFIYLNPWRVHVEAFEGLTMTKLNAVHKPCA